MKQLRISLLLLVVFLIVPQASYAFSGIEEIAAWIKDKNITEFVSLNFNEVSQSEDSKALPAEFTERPCEEHSVTKFRKALLPLNEFSVSKLKFVCYRSLVPEVLLGNNTVLLFSDAVLDMWSDDDIVAAVSHEIFHGYFFLEFRKYRLAEDYEGLQKIELKCDALAVQTLKHIGRDPKSYLKFLKKMEKYTNRPDVYVTVTDKTHPSFSERYDLIRMLTKT